MSDFPHGGSPELTKKWLEENGFNNCFIGWKAEALLGLDKLEDIELVLPRDEALRLHGLLNYARTALPSIQVPPASVQGQKTIVSPPTSYDRVVVIETIKNILNIPTQNLLKEDALKGKNFFKSFGNPPAAGERLPGRVFIRRAYREVAYLVRDEFTTFLAKDDTYTRIITGTPGTGKSIFVGYLVHFLSKLDGVTHIAIDFAQQSDPNKIYHFERVRTPTTSTSSSSSAYSEWDFTTEAIPMSNSTLYISDPKIKDKAVPQRSCHHIIICSPNLKYIEQYRNKDGHSSLVMPVFSIQELIALNELMPKKLPLKDLGGLYMKFGGVPRHIFGTESQRQTFEETMGQRMASLNSSALFKIFDSLRRKTVFFDSESIQNTLLHITVQEHTWVVEEFVAEQERNAENEEQKMEDEAMMDDEEIVDDESEQKDDITKVFEEEFHKMELEMGVESEEIVDFLPVEPTHDYTERNHVRQFGTPMIEMAFQQAFANMGKLKSTSVHHEPPSTSSSRDLVQAQSWQQPTVTQLSRRNLVQVQTSSSNQQARSSSCSGDFVQAQSFSSPSQQPPSKGRKRTVDVVEEFPVQKDAKIEKGRGGRRIKSKVREEENED